MRLVWGIILNKLVVILKCKIWLTLEGIISLMTLFWSDEISLCIRRTCLFLTKVETVDVLGVALGDRTFFDAVRYPF